MPRCTRVALQRGVPAHTSGSTPTAQPGADRPAQREIPLYDIARPFVPPSPDPQAFAGINYLAEQEVPAGNNAPGASATAMAATAAAPPATSFELTENQAVVQPLDAGLEAGRRLTIQQVADSYLVVTSGEAVYLVDQHAAHERIEGSQRDSPAITAPGDLRLDRCVLFRSGCQCLN